MSRAAGEIAVGVREGALRKLLHVIYTPTFSGAHNHAMRMAAPLRERGWKTVVVLPEEKGDGAERLRSAGIEVIQVPLHRPRRRIDPRLHLGLLFGFIPEVVGLRKVIREQDPEIVQVCGTMYLQGGLAAWLERKPLVWQLLGTFTPRPLRHVCMPLICRTADVIMSTGRRVARLHPGAENFGYGDRLFTFVPPLDTGQFRPDPARRARARAKLGVSHDALVVGTLGNQTRQKGHDYLVKAAALVAREMPLARFRILGGAPPTNAEYYGKEVVGLAERLELFAEDRLRIIDPGAETAELLCGFDVFVLTSRAEGLPTVILEAMSSGLPVLSVHVGSVAELISEETGVVLADHSPETISDALISLLPNESLRKRMGEEARRRAVERYDLRFCVETHLDAYERAMSRRPRASHDVERGERNSA